MNTSTAVEKPTHLEMTDTGFIFPYSEEKFNKVNETRKLFESYKNEQNFHYRFNIQKELLSLAKIILNDFRQFLNLQKENDHYSGKRHLFVTDTLNFVLGPKDKKRSIDITSWSGALKIKPVTFDVTDTKKPSKFPELKDQYLDKMYIPVGVELISIWCSKDGGFEDMMETIFLTHDLVYQGNVADPTKKPVVDYGMKFDF